MLHAYQAEGSVAYGVQCKSQPTRRRLSTGQSETPKDISSGRDERGDFMDAYEIFVSHGRSEPSVNNWSKSIDKNRRRSKLPSRSSDMVQGLKELFN